MTVSVTFNGVNYDIPEDGEVGWENLTDYLVALANAATATSIKFNARVSTTTPQTLQSTDGLLYMNVATDSFVNMPAGVKGSIYGVISVTSNKVTVTPNGSQKINNESSYVVSGGYCAALFQYNGTEWVVISEVNDIITKTIRYDNLAPNASFVDGSITALNNFATAADGESCTVDLVGSNAYELILALDSGESLRLSANYLSELISASSDPASLFLISDAGTGLYVWKTSSSNTINFKNRLGSSKIIEIKSLTCNLENITAWG